MGPSGAPIVFIALGRLPLPGLKVTILEDSDPNTRYGYVCFFQPGASNPFVNGWEVPCFLH